MVRKAKKEEAVEPVKKKRATRKKVTKKRVAKRVTKKKVAKKVTKRKSPRRSAKKTTTTEVKKHFWQLEGADRARALKERHDEAVIKNKAKEAREYKYHDFIDLLKLPKKSMNIIPKLSNKEQSLNEMHMLANNMVASGLLTQGQEEVFAEELVRWPGDAVSSMREMVKRAIVDGVTVRNISDVTGSKYHAKRRQADWDMRSEIEGLKKLGLVPAVNSDRRQQAWNFSVSDWEMLLKKFPDPKDGPVEVEKSSKEERELKKLVNAEDFDLEAIKRAVKSLPAKEAAQILKEAVGALPVEPLPLKTNKKDKRLNMADLTEVAKTVNKTSEANEPSKENRRDAALEKAKAALKALTTPSKEVVKINFDGTAQFIEGVQERKEAPCLLDQMDEKFAKAKLELMYAKRFMDESDKGFAQGKRVENQPTHCAASVKNATKAWLKARREFAEMQQLYGL